MPIYAFTCKKGHEFEQFLQSWKDSNPSCQVCDLATERIWSLGSRHVGASTYPYTTTHLTGKPIEVKSARHLEALCKKHKVTHRPDAAYLDRKIVGVNSKGPVYSEGSGRGMPGSWF